MACPPRTIHCGLSPRLPRLADTANAMEPPCGDPDCPHLADQTVWGVLLHGVRRLF